MNGIKKIIKIKEILLFDIKIAVIIEINIRDCNIRLYFFIGIIKKIIPIKLGIKSFCKKAPPMASAPNIPPILPS